MRLLTLKAHMCEQEEVIMLNFNLKKTLVEDAVREGLALRFPAVIMLPNVTYNPMSGVVKLLAATPGSEGKFVSVKVSLRGLDYIHSWLNRLERQQPDFCSRLRAGEFEP